ncbi:hypothetical protein ONZ51_g11473 [Trametes cubensis]|uniref:Uncharacterized protein n=1 Tax=Trametes cubensis TaxID=1111947 RepID=A0AAD7X5E8_9APHY|nr:hypothetical protein ONZ51_g11473 [Trametes cubensis]
MIGIRVVVRHAAGAVGVAVRLMHDDAWRQPLRTLLEPLVPPVSHPRVDGHERPELRAPQRDLAPQPAHAGDVEPGIDGLVRGAHRLLVLVHLEAAQVVILDREGLVREYAREDGGGELVDGCAGVEVVSETESCFDM